MTVDPPKSVLMHCNAGLHHGMGHLMRVLTLSAEASDRGWAVTLAGDFDDVALRIIAESGIEFQRVRGVVLADQGDQLPKLAHEVLPDVIHIDSYLPESDALVGTAQLLSSIQDGAFGVRRADLMIDPNLDAETGPLLSDGDGALLAGVEYALIRSQVRRQRGRWSPTSDRGRVLIVLGGTDPYGFTPRLVHAMSRSPRAPEMTVVAPSAARQELERLAESSSSRIFMTGFLPDLPETAVGHDLVISAAGTSVWDLACMGVPTAMVCVTENQERGYDAAAAHGLAVGIQRSPRYSWDGVADEVIGLLADETRLRNLSAAGLETVDGLGAWRVVSAWESLLRARPRAVGPMTLRHRRASMDDALMLFEWRNDPATRRMSRSTGEIAWEDHLAWLTRVLADGERMLLVVEGDEHPVGTVRWDHLRGIDWGASITLSPASRGRGLASGVLAAGERGIRSFEPRRLIAGINESNEPSRRLFAGAGYLPFTPSDEQGFAEYAKLLPSVSPSTSS